MTFAQSKGHNALVTGATGYIGSNLVKRLIADGWNVHIITRPCSSLNCLAKLSDKLTLHEHDGTTNDMVEIMAKAAPNTVFHLASFFLSEHSPRDVENLITTNMLFSTQLIQAMVENGISRLVNTGTSGQYYNGDTYNPVNLYTATKQAFEKLLEFYLTTSNL
ncbi:MAG: SDR family NAD(P)-dependent oxidoreductase, partial [Kordiimonas sp.]